MEEPLKLELDFLENKDLSETRRHFLDCYNTNGQNHVNYLLTTILAVLAGILGGASLISNGLIIETTVLLSVFITCLLVFLYLLFRSHYWTIWGNFALAITEKQIIKNFNKRNSSMHSYLEGENPPIEAVFQMAVYQSVIEEKKNSKSKFNRLALIGLKK